MLTRIAAIIQIPILVGAVFFVQLPQLGAMELRQNFEFAALVLFMLVVIAFFGPGRFSVDAWLTRKSEQAEKAGQAA